MNLQRMTDVLKKIFKLPPIPTILISVPSFALVIYVLANNMDNMIISYMAYTLSAYAMVITITGMTEIICLIRHGIEEHPFVKKALSIPLFERYLKEVQFRTETSLYQGVFVNLLYVVLKFCSGIYYRSVWFGALAVFISDIMMPEIDGFEFARTVRAVNKTIPILFMSAKDDLQSK